MNSLGGRVICCVALAGLLFFATGCNKRRPTAARRPPPSTRQARSLKDRHIVYEYSCEGCARRQEGPPQDGYVFYEWGGAKWGTHRSYAVLKDGYGMMIFHEWFEHKPIPHFELYSRDNGAILRTANLDEFKRELLRIPAGERLRFFRTCGSTRDGVDPAFLEGLEDFCRDRGIVLRDGGDEVICTCL